MGPRLFLDIVRGNRGDRFCIDHSIPVMKDFIGLVAGGRMGVKGIDSVRTPSVLTDDRNGQFKADFL